MGKGGPDYPQWRDDLVQRVDRVPQEIREVAADYLSGGATVFAVMEYADDVIGGAFGTPGSSAIRTDGTFYWRGDAADYVRTYGVELSDEFLAHARALGWRTPEVTQDEFEEIYTWLKARFRSRPRRFVRSLVSLANRLLRR